MSTAQLPTKNQHYTPDRWFFDILILTLILGCLLAFNMGYAPLSVPDGGRYAEIPREMLITGNFITPHLNGLIYLEKPILFYWLQALSIYIFGLNEAALRLWPMLFALGGCLATYIAGRVLFSRLCGWLASIILATSLLYFAMAQRITLDMPLTVLLTASLYCFLLASRMHPGKKRRWLMWGCYIFSALALLTKGLIGIVFPMAIIGLWIIGGNQWRQLKHLYLISGGIIFLLIALPWHVLVQWQNPDFFNFYFINQHILRYLNKDVGHYQPVWFFVPILMLGFAPWIAFLGQALKHHIVMRKIHPDTYLSGLYLIIWASFIFVFFAISKSKLIPYILPLFPAIALLTGNYFASLWQRRRPPRDCIAGFLLLLLVAVIGNCIYLYAIYGHHHWHIPASSTAFILSCALITLISSIAASISVWRWGTPLAFMIVVIGTTAMLGLYTIARPTLDARSIKPLALHLKPMLKPQDAVIVYGYYYQDLPVYLQRRIEVVNWVNEFAYGLQHQNANAWMISETQFWQSWYSSQRDYVIMQRKQYQRLRKTHPHTHFYVLDKTHRDILLTNHLPIKASYE